MSDAWHSLKVRQFEHVAAGPSTALLRVVGRSSFLHAGTDQRPTLLTHNGPDVRRFAAIPSPPDRRGILRAAYSVPADSVTTATTYSLELTDGSSVTLPAPTPGVARFLPPAPPPAPTGDQQPGEGGERRSESVEKLAELSAALAESRQASVEHRVAREGAEAEIARVRSEADGQVRSASERITALEDQIAAREAEVRRATDERAAAEARDAELKREIEQLTSVANKRETKLRHAEDAVRNVTIERDELSRQAAAFDAVAVKARERASLAEAAGAESASALAELETWRGELERRLAATTTELDTARKGRTADEQDLRRLRGELAETEAKLELAQAEITGLDQQLEELTVEHREEQERHTADVERMTAEREQLEVGHAEAMQAAQDAAKERLHAVEAERDQIAGHAQQLESERDEFGARAGQLAALLAPAERLGELAQDFDQARLQAQSLQSAVAAPPAYRDLDTADAQHREPGEPGAQADGAADSGTPPELAQLGREAETQAREQALRELLEAVASAGDSGG